MIAGPQILEHGRSSSTFGKLQVQGCAVPVSTNKSEAFEGSTSIELVYRGQLLRNAAHSPASLPVLGGYEID